MSTGLGFMLDFWKFERSCRRLRHVLWDSRYFWICTNLEIQDPFYAMASEKWGPLIVGRHFYKWFCIRTFSLWHVCDPLPNSSKPISDALVRKFEDTSSHFQINWREFRSPPQRLSLEEYRDPGESARSRWVNSRNSHLLTGFVRRIDSKSSLH